ncbi:MAG: hypothetical protein IPP71_17950 [Bacteroidetes bacterium]|nr:hypothetical protein [Bacteroidota bacterium]
MTSILVITLMNNLVKRGVLLFFGLFPATFSLVGQPTAVIYNENFNSGIGGWTIGGYNASWSYGIPTLPNIVANGTPCLATGDAGIAQAEPFTACLPVPGPSTNGNYYNCCERSFVESPSINLTGVTSPLLSLDINLYCEQTFDGAKVQLSINGGLSWQDIGTYNSGTFQVFPSTINCREQNWYNKNNVNYLSGTSGGCGTVSYTFGGDKNGWSGGCAQAASGACSSPDVHGTNGWVTATHCIVEAANKPNVKIRVVFGAGSQVFSDGIAIDNVKISDVFPIVNFTSSQLPSCGPEIAFTNNSDCAASWNWNFGHPGFPDNTSTSSDPIHLFPAPGIYSIALTAVDYCGGTSLITKLITVTEGLAPRIDSVKATSSGLCNSATDSILIYLAPLFQGTPPFSVYYNYNGNNSTLNGLTGNPLLISGLQPGSYSSIQIDDANGCETNFSGSVTISFNNDSLELITSNDTTILAGGSAQLMASTNIASSFSWTPIEGLDNPSAATTIASPENTTTYTIIATDINGCTAISEFWFILMM